MGDRQTDRQTDKQADRHAGRQTETRTVREKPNSKTLFYKDCSLDSVKTCLLAKLLMTINT